MPALAACGIDCVRAPSTCPNGDPPLFDPDDDELDDEDDDPEMPGDPDEPDAPEDDPENPHAPDEPPPADDDPPPAEPDDEPEPPASEPHTLSTAPTHVCSNAMPGVYTTDELLLYVGELVPLIVDGVPL